MDKEILKALDYQNQCHFEDDNSKRCINCTQYKWIESSMKCKVCKVDSKSHFNKKERWND